MVIILHGIKGHYLCAYYTHNMISCLNSSSFNVFFVNFFTFNLPHALPTDALLRNAKRYTYNQILTLSV